jgi:uncharacterized repeat protein (TIGR02543 family)
MKRRFFGLGMLAALLVFGLVLTGCPTDGGDGGTTYTVGFAAGEGTGTAPASQTVASGTSIILPNQGNITAPSGKTFASWTAPDGQNYAVGGTYPVTGDITFTARWIDNSAPSYTASFSSGEGSGTVPGSQTVLSEANIALPNQGNMTAPSGQVFDGWSAPNGQTYTAGDSYTVTGDVTFTARWKASSGSDPFAGTWVTSGSQQIKIIAGNNAFTQYFGSGETEFIRGTYTVSGASVTLTINTVNPVVFGGTNTWVSFNALDAAYKEYIGGSRTQQITVTGTTFTVSNGENEATFTKVGGNDAPIEINNLTELNNISANSANLSKNYKLMADITGVTTPIGGVSGGNPIPFTGDFDGNGHAITINITSGLTVSSGPLAGSFAGLFAAAGALSGNPGTSGTVHDLTVKGTISITTGTPVYAGGVIGATLATAEVRNVASSVNVSASGNGNVLAGGIVGVSQGTVSNVYATGNISATSNGAETYAGGIVGASQGAVSYAYATGSISAAATGIGPGESDHSVTVGAGGIAGAATTGAPIRYTVALNSAVSATGTNYNRCSFRITSTSSGIVLTNGATNYGRADLTPTGGLYGIDKGANRMGGLDVTVTGGPLPSAYTAPNQTWWTGTGFNGADWNTVWRWDMATGLPKLRTTE